MKKSILLALFTCTAWANAPENIMITQFCEYYHQRSYFILRLEQIISGIKKHKAKDVEFRFNHDQYHSPIIIQCIKDIEKNNSLEPFYNLWKDVKKFKHLEDQSFALDITKLLFSIQHTLYEHTKTLKDPLSFDIELYLGGTSFTEATTIRRYHVKRLSHMIGLLKRVKCSQRSLFEAEREECDCSFITHYDFSSKPIRACIAQMEEQKSLNPLFDLYNEFVSFKLIQDEVFLREFISLTFIISRNIFVNNLHNPPTMLQKRRKSHIAHIYENLDKIPIEEILDAIDLLNKELPELLEKYELNSNMSWKKWFKKYWWVHPAIFTVMTFRIYWKIYYPDQELGPNPLLTPRSHNNDEQG